jgi:hypothetical protein
MIHETTANKKRNDLVDEFTEVIYRYERFTIFPFKEPLTPKIETPMLVVALDP